MRTGEIFLVLAVMLTAGRGSASPNSLLSKVKTDMKFKDSTIDQQTIYSIEVERISTSEEDEPVKCTASPKKIKVSSDFELVDSFDFAYDIDDPMPFDSELMEGLFVLRRK